MGGERRQKRVSHMKGRRAVSVALVLSTAAAGLALGQGSRSVTFDFLKLGTAPSAFDCDVTGPGGPARWVVTQSPAEGGIRRVLAQTSQIAAPDRLPHCLLRNYRGADVDVVALVRPVGGERAQAGG